MCSDGSHSRTGEPQPASQHATFREKRAWLRAAIYVYLTCTCTYGYIHTYIVLSACHIGAEEAVDHPSVVSPSCGRRTRYRACPLYSS